MQETNRWARHAEALTTSRDSNKEVSSSFQLVKILLRINQRGNATTDRCRRRQCQARQPRESIFEEVTLKLRLQRTHCVTLGRIHSLSEIQSFLPHRDSEGKAKDLTGLQERDVKAHGPGSPAHTQTLWLLPFSEGWRPVASEKAQEVSTGMPALSGTTTASGTCLCLPH